MKAIQAQLQSGPLKSGPSDWSSTGSKLQLYIFIIQGFWTIVVIFFVIFTTFRSIRRSAFFWSFLLNAGAYTKLPTTSFI